MTFINPKYVLVDFLRNRLTDPRARAEASRNETFNGGSTDFELAPSVGKVSCISSVSVGGVAQTKWKDYYINFQDQEVIFFSNTASGTDNVSITYKQGTSNWIYPDKARKSLSKTSFPRINVLKVAGSGKRLGQYNSDVETSGNFQIDLWIKEGQTFTISGKVYADDKLTDYLGYEITRMFRTYENDLHPALYNYLLLGSPRDIGFDKEMECFHNIVEVELKSINDGESYA